MIVLPKLHYFGKTSCEVFEKFPRPPDRSIVEKYITHTRRRVRTINGRAGPASESQMAVLQHMVAALRNSLIRSGGGHSGGRKKEKEHEAA